ncbi:SDR family NAD(P)-dependent oxidoreductase [Anatilimnocola floriformis]|uniref:SDR family NAD(P)-dependent oxidoreductase n=1 Tax=Anatilimnocola floriformis TaxID=2948575 RepID=UPI0020C23187|nr:SDR family oxidoreductase [Anatilimnocola floriformis]
MNTQAPVVVITGASQGIGAGLVQGFLAQGYRVVANSRSIKADSNPNVLTVAGDISSPTVAEQVIAAAVEKFGRVDTLVNNAGMFLAKPFTEYTVEDFNRVISLNLGGFFYVTQQAIGQMLKQGGGGHIVNLTTSLVRQPMKGVSAAMASITKGGLDAVTRGLAIEYADQKIRVNAVAPGIIETPMHAPETHDFLASLQPLNRMGSVQEVVDAVLYLEGAKFVTGETLHVAGGAQAGKW